MANPQKNKGDRHERDTASQFSAVLDREVPRIRAGWDDDRGDLELPGHIVECKAHAQWRPQEWLRDTTGKCRDGEVPIVVAKQPRGRSVAILHLDDLLPMLRAHLEREERP